MTAVFSTLNGPTLMNSLLKKLSGQCTVALIVVALCRKVQSCLGAARLSASGWTH